LLDRHVTATRAGAMRSASAVSSGSIRKRSTEKSSRAKTFENRKTSP